jgi:hypothetical protein
MSKTIPVPVGQAITISAVSSNPADPPLELTWTPTFAAGSVGTVTVKFTAAAGHSESHTFTITATKAAHAQPASGTPPVGPFVDTPYVFSDAGNGSIAVQNGSLTTQISMDSIDSIFANTPDPTPYETFNIAARLSLSGITSVQTAPGSGVASAAALACLNAASFKSY